MSNTDGKLKAGMFAEVNFAKSTSDGAVIVPRDSVLRDGDDYYAFVIEGGKVRKLMLQSVLMPAKLLKLRVVSRLVIRL